MTRRRGGGEAAMLLLFLTSGVVRAGSLRYDVDAARSRVEAHTTKAGMLSRFGHTHGVLAHDYSGRVELDPEHLDRSSVHLAVDATTLEILAGELGEGDRAKVQANMVGEDILHVKKHPTITFDSKKVTSRGVRGPVMLLEIEGEFGMHGVSKTLSLPVEVKFDAQSLDARGEFSLNQSDFGIRPFSAMLGSIRVGDEVTFRYTIHAGVPAVEPVKAP